MPWVRGVFATLLITGGVLAAPVERPKAESVLPAPGELPGRYVYPWQTGVTNAKYRTEEQWRADNPAPLVGVQQGVEQIKQIPAEEWAKMRQEMRKLLDDPSKLGALAQNPAQQAFMRAIADNESQAAAAAALQAAYKDVVDAAFMEYVKIEGVLDGDKPPDKAVRLRVGLQVWRDEAIPERSEAIDLDAGEVDQLVKTIRDVYEQILRKMVVKKCSDLEGDLIDAYADKATPERTQAILEEMSAYAAVQVSVKSDRPPIGSASHMVVLTRGPLPDSPPAVQGQAQVRRGVAVFYIGVDAAGKGTETFHEELKRIMELLANRAGGFDL